MRLDFKTAKIKSLIFAFLNKCLALFGYICGGLDKYTFLKAKYLPPFFVFCYHFFLFYLRIAFLP